MTEDEIARRLADVGAQLGGRFDTDRAGLSLRTLVERAGAAAGARHLRAHPAPPGVSAGGAGAREGAADRRAQGGRHPARHHRVAAISTAWCTATIPYALRVLGRGGDGGEDHARGPGGVPPAPLRRAARGGRDDRRRLARRGGGDRGAGDARPAARRRRGAAAAAGAGARRRRVARHPASRRRRRTS